MDRRTWLTAMAAVAAVAACDRTSIDGSRAYAKTRDRFGSPDLFSSKITIDPAHPGAPANHRLCGSNVQWVDGGDGLLPATGTTMVASVLERVKQLGPTVIRYPGGSQSDVFNWRASIGDASVRGSSEHFHRKGRRQIVRFGTAEFLSLCELIGAEPLITVNVATGSARDAGEWVRQTNVTGMKSPMTGRSLPKVPFWEIGNEPYLKEDHRAETWLEPPEFARRANAAIREMRKEDASIQIGIPLRSDSFNGIPVTPHQGFNQRLLPAISEKFDFVSLHNTYLPFLYDNTPDDDDIYVGLMAASETVRADLDATRTQLVSLVPGRTLPLAITEYNAFVTLGRRQDAFLASPAGALYVADLLRLFAMQPDILMANHWSLIGNWYFGAITSQGSPRPVFEVLRMYREVLRGNMLSLDVQTKTFSASRIGLMREASNVPVVTGIATLQANRLKLLLINKDPHASANASLQLTTGRFANTRLRTLVARAPFAAPDAADAFIKSESNPVADNGLLTVALPPCSLSLLDATIS